MRLEVGGFMRTHRLFKNKKGQTMVETIFVLPLLFLLIFGIIEFGRIYFTYMMISNAAREGARYSAVGMSSTDVEGHIDHVTSTVGTVVVNIEDDASGDNVIVSVTHNLELIMPIIGPMISSDGHFDVQAQAEMRKE
jgi:hypothetical protein